MADFKPWYNYKESILSVDQYLYHTSHQVGWKNKIKSFFWVRTLALRTTLAGTITLVATVVILLIRTIGCAFLTPPIKIARLLFGNLSGVGKKLEKLDNEESSFFRLKKVGKDAFRIGKFIPSLLINISFGVVINPNMDIWIQTALGHVPAATLKTAPYWSEEERIIAAALQEKERKDQEALDKANEEKVTRLENEIKTLKDRVKELEEKRNTFNERLLEVLREVWQGRENLNAFKKSLVELLGQTSLSQSQSLIEKIKQLVDSPRIPLNLVFFQLNEKTLNKYGTLIGK